MDLWVFAVCIDRCSLCMDWSGLLMARSRSRMDRSRLPVDWSRLQRNRYTLSMKQSRLRMNYGWHHQVFNLSAACVLCVFCVFFFLSLSGSNKEKNQGPGVTWVRLLLSKTASPWALWARLEPLEYIDIRWSSRANKKLNIHTNFVCKDWDQEKRGFLPPPPTPPSCIGLN